MSARFGRPGNRLIASDFTLQLADTRPTESLFFNGEEIREPRLFRRRAAQQLRDLAMQMQDRRIGLQQRQITRQKSIIRLIG